MDIPIKDEVGRMNFILHPSSFILKMVSLFFCLSLSGNLWASSKVIVLGFDGADPILTRKYIDEGYLPNLRKLEEQGTFSPLRTTNPAQSPVSWCVFETGTNPGKTGIFDFLKREANSYLPELSFAHEEKLPILPEEWQRVLVAVGIGVFVTIIFAGVFLGLRALVRWLAGKEKRRSVVPVAMAIFVGLAATVAVDYAFKYIPTSLPAPVNNREGTPFWQITGKAGIKTKVLFAPVSFPADNIHDGCLLSGLGVPDMRRTPSFWTLYTTEISGETTTITGGTVIHLIPKNSKAVSIVEERDPVIEGPANFVTDESTVFVPFGLQFSEEQNSATITLQGKSQTIRVGDWTDWVEIKFQLNPLIAIYGLTRFYLNQVTPFLSLYMEPLSFHPQKLPLSVNISSPRSYSSYLAKTYGLFETVGWDIATNPLRDEKIDEKAFLEDLNFSWQNGRRMVLGELDKKEWDCFVGIFMATDRVQHMFWRAIDPQHPAYTPEIAEKYGDEIRKVYQMMDDLVGEVMQRYVGGDTTLFVVSDHGFKSLRKEVNLNTWLVEQGLLAMKPDAVRRQLQMKSLFHPVELWKDVDWSLSRAYAMGLGKIYVNLRGRDYGPFQGVVKPGEEYEQLLDTIKEQLLAMRDPETGEKVVRSVYKTKEIYSGDYLDRTGDLEVGFNEGYRVSWQTTLGGIPSDVIEVNKSKWSGDHCSVDPPIIPGIFLSNLKLVSDSPGMEDIAPTILRQLGLAVPAEMDGRPLQFQANQQGVNATKNRSPIKGQNNES